MRTRYAAAAGAAAVAVAVGVFLLIPHHPIAGTNTIAPLNPVVGLGGGKSVCEEVPRLPSDAGSVRLRAARGTPVEVYAADRNTSRFDSIAGLTVTIEDRRGGRISSGTVRDVDSGKITVPLRPVPPAAAPVRLCVSNLDRQVVSVFGELKRPFPGAPLAQQEPVVGMTFLEAESQTWLSRLTTIARRYGYGHAGILGSWALALAGLLAVALSALAMRQIVRDAERG
jgi:hypothetical protein